MSPDEYCVDKVAKAGSTLYYGFLFVAQDKRRAAIAIHAFAREIREIVDHSSDLGLAHARLAWWRQQIRTVYAGSPEHPVARALQNIVAIYRLEEERFQEVIDGVATNLGQNRYASFESLTHYCQRTTGAVSALCAELFGHEHRSTPVCARDIGVAIELTRIIRDLGQSARRGRIYVPIDEMARFDVKPADVLHRRNTAEFARLAEFQIGRTERLFGSALAGIAPGDRRAQCPTLTVGAIYQAVLDEIGREPDCVLHRHVDLTPLRKLWIAWRTRMN